MIEINITTEQAEGLEQFVEQHATLCQAELMGDEVPEDWSPYSPYDGCSTCETREYLMATFDFLRQNNIVSIYVKDEEQDDSATLFD